LEFLEGQGQFAQSYTETVVERIFYCANRSWDGKLTLSQFRKADIAGILRTIENGIDVDVECPGVFSYKHFYVLFCSFFELDSNRDRLLDARDLLRYFSGTLSRRTISRIMMGKGKPSEHSIARAANGDDSRSKAKVDKRKAKLSSRYDLNVRLSDSRMTYCDFIWFLLSEIDKTSPTAVEYWFRCLDLDGDGVLTRQLAQLSMRSLPNASFKDVIQMRIDFLASLPNPWVEFADCEYAALLKDHEEQEGQTESADPVQTDTHASDGVLVA
ncbi:Serine/threonine-protein phosphatase 2A regulatory subunit B'' subunit alpha, partial [Coemansia sp. RSA 2673]